MIISRDVAARARVALAIGASMLCAASLFAQTSRRGVALSATDAGSLRAAATRVEGMLRSGELDLTRVDDDTQIQGRTHERLEQRFKGLPVFGGSVVRQFEGQQVRTVFGTVYEGISLDTTPALDGPAAAARALAAHGGPAVGNAVPGVLGVLPTRRGDFALAWQVTVRTGRDIRTVMVNAATGVIERDVSQLRDQLPNIGSGTGVLGDAKKIAATRDSQGFDATDHTRPAVITTYDFHGSIDRFNAFFETDQLFPSDVAVDGDNAWTDPATVDAHVYMGWTYDFYFKQFGRSGMDDRNGGLTAIVHPASRDDADLAPGLVLNASYIGGREVFFGDGDGVTVTYFSGALDVVAHEWSHGVTDYSSGLNYVDESGALNEAFSDVMGASAEFFFEPSGAGPRHADWLIGEDITLTPPPFIRSMSNPIEGGTADHYSVRQFIGTDTDNGGVHFNCTIVDHAYYLAVNGGTNRVSGIHVNGVGLANIDRMEKIFYRGFVFFLTSEAQFHDARVATLQAASELYGAGGNEYSQLAQAWTAVGVN